MRRLSAATWTLILLLLAILLWVLAARAADPPYRRADWLPGWADADKNCRDTRQEVLARDALWNSLLWAPGNCRVASGWWRDTYTGEVVKGDPLALDADHVVPLGWAHTHGGAAWPPEKKHQFANELDYRGAIVLTRQSLNRSKGDKGPSEWIPPKDGWIACEYGLAWSVVTTLYDLRLEDSERAAIRLLVRSC